MQGGPPFLVWLLTALALNPISGSAQVATPVSAVIELPAPTGPLRRRPDRL